jgi:hypothetical protein
MAAYGDRLDDGPRIQKDSSWHPCRCMWLWKGHPCVVPGLFAPHQAKGDQQDLYESFEISKSPEKRPAKQQPASIRSRPTAGIVDVWVREIDTLGDQLNL